jgi:hypothetical protein
VKVIEMLGSEGPQTGDELGKRLPFPRKMVDRILLELETRNVLSVGFYKQTDDAEYILKIDEHRLIDGSEDVVEYRWVQNLVFDKTFKKYDDGFAAFDSHVLFQKQQELLYRVNDFRFKDWQDMQLDSDIIMGRLLHNRMGYTNKETIPMLLGLKPEPWIGAMEEELLRRIPIGENVTRQEIMDGFPKGDEHRALQRDLKYAMSNLERQMLVVKQFEDVSGRRRRLSLFHRVHGVYEALDFESSLVDLIRRMGPVKGNTLRFYVTRTFEDLTVALMNLEKDGRIAKVMALKNNQYRLIGDLKGEIVIQINHISLQIKLS